MPGIREGEKFRRIAALPRLKVPESHSTNGPAAVSMGSGGSQKPATALPSPTALPVTWGPALTYLYSEVGLREALALGSQLLDGTDITLFAYHKTTGPLRTIARIRFSTAALQ